MSLATRCPACGTIFRVVQDQLKVSEGWVRCGQCHEVFHGIEALFDLDSDPAVAARRAAARGPVAPPPTRVFADQRASAPIPMPTPAARVAPVAAPAPIAIPARPVQDVPSAGAPQSVPATPSAFGASSPPPATPGIRPGYTGFTPATRPMPPPSAPPAPLPPPAFVAPPAAFGPPPVPAPPAAATPFAPIATRGTIAPRFAARLAEEAARAQTAVPDFPPSPIPSAYPPPAAPVEPASTPAFTPEAAPAFVPVPPPAFAPVPIPAPAPAPAPYAAMPGYVPPSIAANRASVFAPPPPAEAPSSAADLASAFAAPAPEGPVPVAAPAPAEPAPEPDSAIAHETAPNADGSMMPGRPADDAADDLRAGPPTLASMLPEDAGDWPPRRTKKRAANASTPTGEIALVDRSKDPRFLREAKAGARWRKPWVRTVLGVTLLLLIVAAIGQVAWPQRDMLASRWPATLPAWNWLCEQADCRIEAPRAIASLALDGSSLTRTDTEHVLLFSADLHNRSDHAVRMPSFDLTFMDLNGEIVARKVLTPAQIGIQQAALPPEGELHVHARLQVGTLPASGFQADLFYP